ncbi:ArsR family transcriptional regulator [Patescibacteria group bacterium]|nr:MAG: ArsR family transcriptional regulator [Patescibacteria group bacterium]
MAKQSKVKLREKPKQTRKSEQAKTEAVAITKALGHPQRRQVIICLSVGDKAMSSPSKVADFIDEPLGTVSYHARKLLELGMIAEFDTTPARGAIEHHYRLTALGKRAFERITLDNPEEVDALLEPDES